MLEKEEESEFHHIFPSQNKVTASVACLPTAHGQGNKTGMSGRVECKAEWRVSGVWRIAEPNLFSPPSHFFPHASP